MKNKIINALIELGMPASVKGFDYIIDAITILNDVDWGYESKITALYYKVAKKNNTTTARVERCIRHAFSIVLMEGNEDAINKYLPKTKRTNGNLLKTLSFKIFMEEEPNE